MSSPSPEIMRQFGERQQATWTRELVYDHGQVTWEFLLSLGQESYEWLRADAQRSRWALTTDGTCLVATLSYPTDGGGFRVYQCTIPRGQWHTLMETYGARRAPSWWEASETRAAANGRPQRRAFHAEDGVYYLAETGNVHDGLPSLMGETRIIVYGIKAGSTRAGQVNLCTDVFRKNPPCSEVAGNLHITSITVRAAEQDRAERDRGGSDGYYRAPKPPGPGGASDPRRPAGGRPTGRGCGSNGGGIMGSTSTSGRTGDPSSSRGSAPGNGGSSGRTQATSHTASQTTASSAGVKRGSGR